LERKNSEDFHGIPRVLQPSEAKARLKRESPTGPRRHAAVPLARITCEGAVKFACLLGLSRKEARQAREREKRKAASPAPLSSAQLSPARHAAAHASVLACYAVGATDYCHEAGSSSLQGRAAPLALVVPCGYRRPGAGP